MTTDTIGWWECTDDITEFNRQLEKQGQRIVFSWGPGFQYLELQQQATFSLAGDVAKPEGNWITAKRIVIEFFVNRGHYDNKGEWVTEKLSVFMIGEPSFLAWEPCDEPPEYENRLPGTSSMIISANDPPQQPTHQIIKIGE